MDLLELTITQPEVFQFQKVSSLNPSTGEYIEMTPELPTLKLNQSVLIPPMVDMISQINVVIKQTCDMAENSMNTIIIGSFVINFLISVSMKKLLETIRIF